MSSLFSKGIYKYLNKKESKPGSRIQNDLAKILINYKPKSSKPSKRKKYK